MPTPLTAGGLGIGGAAGGGDRGSGGPGGPGGRPGGDASPLTDGLGPGDDGLLGSLAIGLVSAAVGGLLLLFMFVLVGRRRRGAGDLELVPAGPIADFAAAARAATAAPTLLAAPVWAVPGGDMLPSEAGVPRWRRQSLRETRMRSERDPSAPRVPLVFRTPPAPGIERRLVAYSLVRLSSEPDEILGEELGRLDRGDEVEVLETRGVHWLVRTPDDGIGWIHRTTLEAAAAQPVSTDDDSEPAEGLPDGSLPGAASGTAEAGAKSDAEPDGATGDFFRFSTGGLGARNGEPRVH